MEFLKRAITPQDDTLPPNVKIVNSARAKRIALRLDSKVGIMNLVIPRGVSEAKAIRFAKGHEKWIAKRLAELPQPISYEDDMVLPVMGHDVRLYVSQDTTLKRTHISLNNKDLLISTNLEDYAPRLKRYLRSLAKEKLGEMAHMKAESIGKTISDIQIRDTKSRWGSCSPTGRISLSWRLIHAPAEALDYVVAHEVAHLKHMNHGKHFWALCEELCDDYKNGKTWMRSNGHTLMRF